MNPGCSFAVLAFVGTLALAWVSVANAQNLFCDLPNLPTVPDFDTKRMEGVWHVQDEFSRGNVQPTNPNYQCLVHEISDEDGMTYFRKFSTQYTLESGEAKENNTIAYIMPENTAIWVLTPNLVREDFQTGFIDTDYESYAIHYFCPLLDPYIRHVRMFILTRDKSPSKGLMDRLEEVVQGFQFSTDSLIRHNNTRC